MGSLASSCAVWRARRRGVWAMARAVATYSAADDTTSLVCMGGGAVGGGGWAGVVGVVMVMSDDVASGGDGCLLESCPESCTCP
jgi:hypothetical protein